MHHPIDPDTLARVVSSKVSGNDDDYQYQEDCGTSDTSSFHKLVKKSDIHQTILVGVMSCVVPEGRGEHIAKHKFEQNVAFLAQASDHKFHSHCPKVIAIGNPTTDLAFPWVVYEHVDGWPLGSSWHQLKHEIRVEVIQNLASFVCELASVAAIPTGKSNPGASFVGSADEGHILVPPALSPYAILLTDEELKKVTSYGALIELLATNHAHQMSLKANTNQTNSLAAQQILTIAPVCKAILDSPTPKVLAHLNLIPSNVWVDPFTGKITAIFGWEYAQLAPSWMVTAPLPWLTNKKQEMMLDSETSGDPWSVWKPRFQRLSENTGREIRKLRTTWETSLHTSSPSHLPFGRGHEDALKRQAMKACFMDAKALKDCVQWAREVVLPSVSTLRPSMLAQNVLFLTLAAAIVSSVHYFLPALITAVGMDPLSLITVVWAILLSATYSFRQSKRSTTLVFHPPSNTGIKLQTQQANVLLWRLDMVFIKTYLLWFLGYTHPKDNKNPQLSAVPFSPTNSIQPTGTYMPNLMSRVNTSF